MKHNLLILGALSLASCTTRLPVKSAKEFYDPDNSRLPAADVVPYKLKGKCDGFPRIMDVKTAPGLCLGLVDGNGGLLEVQSDGSYRVMLGSDRTPKADPNSDKSIPMRRPRAITAYGDDLVFVDMAGWQQKKGQVFLLKKRADGKYRRFLLIDFAEFPLEKRRLFYMVSTIQLGPDGKIWIGSAESLLRFNPFAELFNGEASADYDDSRQVELRRRIRDSLEVMLDKLPYRSWVNDHEDSLHPLKPFVFSKDGSSLYLGIGASTDNCGTDHRPGDKCAEGEARADGELGANAAMYRYQLDSAFKPKGKPELVARGLRNSLAIAVDPSSGDLYQGENSRDIRGAVHLNRLGPPDELNVIRDDQHYGWPYCVSTDQLQREYAGGDWNCAKYTAPLLLLPPHSAPLQMMFYTGEKLPAWYSGKMILPLHGREDFGHRIVTFETGSDGRPKGTPLDMVYGWGSLTNPSVSLGTPMGIAQASDGSIIIVEDQSRRIVRLSVIAGEGNGLPKPASPDQEWVRTNVH
ncbi:MAG: PQQ-dependent sugar dehydrogenase [Bdellovibrionota bacterium]